MAILGAHMSIAGGYYKAVEAAHRAGCDCVQLFTKNNNQWKGKELSDDDAERFKAALKERGIAHPISHDSYLINLGSPNDELWKKSIDALVIELQRAEKLGIPYVVAHPGAFTTSSEEAGLKRIAKGLDEVHKQTKKIDAQVLLETTAGQGSNLGWKFEHLGEIIDKTKDPDRLGVCFDTCHVFAGGYAMDTPKAYKATMKQLDAAVGLDKVRAFHLNDSLKPLGSRVDRHAAIGRGEMGLEPFRNLLNDRRFKKTPMYMETPKGEEDGEDLDVINLRTLRGLIK
ncbi:Endonuclease 4 [Pseudobythopirellula maris]|uniref:Probable endonuclease 4 n=1 Tax=Pseudobythopirellula maris TaxID=2527991 RepID=A0A5C5ZRR9_9BACT|nr:deoxyribonuclease IV [Pseudobythopirellula maris]TWT89990.1 Endonuclease 4 [Pseudobythopirellula maris]